MKEVKGSKVTLQRGEEIKTRAKNNVKLVKKRPKELEYNEPKKTTPKFGKLKKTAHEHDELKKTVPGYGELKKKRGTELDLEVSWKRIQAMGADGEAEEDDGGRRQAEEDRAQVRQAEEDRAPVRQEEDGADAGADSTNDETDNEDGGTDGAEGGEEEEEEEGQEEEGRRGGADLEAIRLMDMLHLGDYWPVVEGTARRRRPPPRLGVEHEQERGDWEERLPRELSMGDPGSRQLTPHSSPPALKQDQYDQLLDAPLNTPNQTLAAKDDASDDNDSENAPEHQHLPASRSWDRDEIDALRLNWSRPPRCNLVCIHHFCPDLAGADEPDQMEEIRLGRD